MDSINKGMKSSDHPAKAAVTFIMTTVIALQLWMALPHGAPWRIGLCIISTDGRSERPSQPMFDPRGVFRCFHRYIKWHFISDVLGALDLTSNLSSKLRWQDSQSESLKERLRQAISQLHHEHNGSQQVKKHGRQKVAKLEVSGELRWQWC